MGTFNSCKKKVYYLKIHFLLSQYPPHPHIHTLATCITGAFKLSSQHSKYYKYTQLNDSVTNFAQSDTVTAELEMKLFFPSVENHCFNITKRTKLVVIKNL